jgi:hypothetical protein
MQSLLHMLNRDARRTLVGRGSSARPSREQRQLSRPSEKQDPGESLPLSLSKSRPRPTIS